ncbi:hypothetical protein [Halocynthiibacter namhaensis]|uniref:hypothetical protein n=1 Tax=Halocynthiibacter namhaensis TaxID=1290553 RepID=UPI0012E05325|nr:hypothetical protein [Halocynthiibacter namhaensis]
MNIYGLIRRFGFMALRKGVDRFGQPKNGEKSAQSPERKKQMHQSINMIQRLMRMMRF